MYQITLSKNKPYYNVALLLVVACGTTKECFIKFFSYDEKWRKFANWFWSNEKKTKLLNKINVAQGIDLEEWYWSNQ